MRRKTCRRHEPITCSDTVGFEPTTGGIIVATTGLYTLLLDGNGTTAVPVQLAAGVLHELCVKRVNSTNAASTSNVVAVYED